MKDIQMLYDILEKDMAGIEKKDIEYLAKLAKIALTETEAGKLQKDLGEILGYVHKLSSVDTKGVKPTSQVTGLVDVLRPDVPWDKAWSRDELLANAPATKDGYIKVPKVL